MVDKRERDRTWVFLCGADMSPERILEQPATAHSRFESIATVPGAIAGKVGLPTELANDQVWGIVLSACDVNGRTVELGVEIQLRNGTTQRCVVLTTPATVGTVIEILAEARYWEVPLDYRDRLAALIDG